MLVDAGLNVVVESGGKLYIDLCFVYSRILCNISHIHTHINTPLNHTAGEKASFSDESYIQCGASILPNQAEIYKASTILTKIRPPTSASEISLLKDKTLIGMISPSINTELYDTLTNQNTNVFALDNVPRMLSRAQSYDVLSSQANIAGYRAVIEAANNFPRFFAGQMTAAGKVPPAKVLVLGVGVAGLAAIQTAKNMGAIVRAFDVRAVTKEQVESMGATFLEVEIEEDGAGSGGYAKVRRDCLSIVFVCLTIDRETHLMLKL